MSGINGINGVDPLGSGDSSKKKDVQALGQEEFLKILMAQVQNQDPLSPQDNAEFLGQMAQFSSVQGINDLSKSMNSMVDMMQSNQALQASSMVGRHVRIEGNQATLAGGELSGAVNIPLGVTQAEVSILDGSGNVVSKIDLSSKQGDGVAFSWDGKDANGQALPAGNYQLLASGRQGGESVRLNTLADIQVESVSFGGAGGQMTLNLKHNAGQISMDKVLELRA